MALDSMSFLHCAPAIVASRHRSPKTLAHIRETEEFLERTVQKALQDCTKDLQLDLDTVYSPSILSCTTQSCLAWLIANKVPFTPSTALFDEIMRFHAYSWSKSSDLLLEIGQAKGISFGQTIILSKLQTPSQQ